ncbi:MAG: glycoside hydrolase [Steroidobacteraceae bacterium]
MRVVLLWHLHQPDYRVDGRFTRPWVYLHALAGYTEMAGHLQACKTMRAVVNFTPVLLDQLHDYARRLHAWKAHRRPLRDALLDSLGETPPPGPARAKAVQSCLSALDGPRAKREPCYRTLAESALRHDPATLPDALFTDLLVWFHLCWLGESLRADPRAKLLLERAADFGRDERHELLELIADAITRVVPRWRALADEDRIELSTSPFYHPLCPLLLDFGSVRDRAPTAALPSVPYPGGEERLRWQLDAGLDRFESLLGRRAAGCWPPEAALSEATLYQLAKSGFEWTASSHSVLEATFKFHTGAGREPFRLFRHPGSGMYCAFRDDGLSDRIGFEYQRWQPADAVRDLTQHLETIARGPDHDLVLIALDGENPWEYYPDAGGGFLRGLYEALGSHRTLSPATMKDCVRELAREAVALPTLRAGSWVHGELLTWVGHPEKNHAWEMLIDAKRRYDESGRADPELRHRLGACEGSDWFWWPGVHNPTAAVAQFDDLFRAQLSALYGALELCPPDALSRPFATGVGHEVAAGGTMQRGS